LDSNEFLSKFLWHNIEETFLASQLIQRLAKNPLFDVISLHGPTSASSVMSELLDDIAKAAF
jgi:hypothetical protein